MAGRIVARELGLPAWLGDALLPCGLEPPLDRGLEHIVSAACLVATEIGLPGSASPCAEGLAPGVEGCVEAIRAALDRAGGVPWLEERIRGPLVAARQGFAAAIAAA